MFPDDADVSENMGKFLDHSLPTLEGMEATAINRAAMVLKRIGPRWLFERIWRPYVARMLAQKEICKCPLTTISQIIADQVYLQVSVSSLKARCRMASCLHRLTELQRPVDANRSHTKQMDRCKHFWDRILAWHCRGLQG